MTFKIKTSIVAIILIIFIVPWTHSDQYYTYGNQSQDGIGKFYMGREISNVIGGHGAIEWLERKEREREEKPRVVIDSLQLKPTDVVADIGAGSGYFTFRIAPLVPQGKVYAVEIGREMIEFIEEKKKRLGVRNIETVLGTIQDTNLPDSSVDVVSMVDAYHEFSHPHEMMESITKALKPDGRVVFVEYKGEDPNIPIKPLHKMTVKQVEKEMNVIGLELTRALDVLPIQHIIEFKRKEIKKLKEPFTISEEARLFPNQDYVSNQEIVRNLRNEDKVSNQEIAKKFANVNRPTNRELIRQRKAQDRLKSIEIPVDLFDDHADVIVLTVSGISKRENNFLMDTLKTEIGFIKDMKVIETKKDVAVFGVILRRMNVKQFAQTLDGYNIGGSYLDLIRYNENSIDLVFKP